jgi:hypothetical protein
MLITNEAVARGSTGLGISLLGGRNPSPINFKSVGYDVFFWDFERRFGERIVYFFGEIL